MKVSEREPGDQPDQTRCERLVAYMLDAAFVLDQQGKIVHGNKLAEVLVASPLSALIGQRLSDLLHPADRDVALLLLRKSEGFVRNIRIQRKDGSLVWTDLMATRADPYLVVVVRDVTEQKRLEETIHRMACYDDLTGLPNQRFLIEQINALAESRPHVLLVIGLDRFKEINAAFGRRCGDLLLEQIASRLKEVVEKSALLARLEGDRFAALFPEGTEAEDAVQVAKAILSSLETSFSVEGLPVWVRASIGISLFPEQAGGALLRCADLALHAAKKSAVGYVLYSPACDPQTPLQLELMGDLARAIETDQLFLVYQPKIDLKTGQVVGVEALVRWQHPQYELIPPSEFLLPAEQTGLIHPLTLWVLKRALGDCQAWHQAGVKINIAVNLSPRNLQDPKFPDDVAHLLSEHGVAASFLELEIPERGLREYRLLEPLARLSKIGVKIVIDDFGYSVFGTLRGFPVDQIKIDKVFINDMAVDYDSAVVARSTIELGHTFHLSVVAEGVEDRETMDRLTDLGCDAAQGYHLSEPLSAEALAQWLRERA